MQLEKLKTFILDKLHREIPHWQTYHSPLHTEEVFQHSFQLGVAEGLSNNELIILQTAAILHDTGFLITIIDHEKASCKIAREYLPEYEYNQQQVDQICSIIMATQMPQSPFDKLSMILCDADLYYLGTNNYQLYSGRLYRELKHHSLDMSDDDWHQLQKDFLQSHQYFTNAAKNKLNAGKRSNFRRVKKNHKHQVHSHNDFGASDIILMLFGALIAGFALSGFLLPNNFLDGGVTGISLLIHGVFGWEFPIVFTVLSIPLVILASYVVNKKFAVKAAISIICMSLCTHFLPYPVITSAITSDKLLIAIFGGFFAGIGMGLSIRAGSALDGIDVLAVYTLKRSSFTISEIILGINSIIFIIAASHFGIETAMYSILSYFTATKTVDYVVEGVEAYTGVTIISAHSERIKEKLVNEMGKGITVYKGERGFLPGKYEIHTDVDIIFTVITRLELRRLKNLVYAEDPKAFIFASTIKETSGGVIKRRASH